jgi:hypothetical protein
MLVAAEFPLRDVNIIERCPASGSAACRDRTRSRIVERVGRNRPFGHGIAKADSGQHYDGSMAHSVRDGE